MSSFSTHPTGSLPVYEHTHTRKPKSRSIGSLPLPLPSHSLSLRLTPTDTLSTFSSSVSSAPDMRGIRSPSRLPATECMSYFPPFEAMGSVSSSSSPTASSSAAGPSTYAKKRNTRDKENESHHRGHAKGRSLGSLAGIMSFLSPGLSSPQQQQQHQQPPSLAAGTGAPPALRSTSDGDVLQALTKRVTPGKRRVLEPMSLGNDSMTQSLSMGAVAIHKRRMRSEAEVEGLLNDRGQKTRSGDKLDISEAEEEGLVEDLVSDTPTHSRRRPRPHLSFPLPTLPMWRFPMPSPPVTCLSPDIPLEAFTSPIENPLTSAPPSRETSPMTDHFNPLHMPQYSASSSRADEEADADEVELDLSPTESCSDSLSSIASTTSRPSTPERSGDVEDWHSDESLSPSDSIRTIGSYAAAGDQLYLGPKLERTISQISCDSKETIRPDNPREMNEKGLGGRGDGEKGNGGEVTPKAGRGWRGVMADHDLAAV